MTDLDQTSRRVAAVTGATGAIGKAIAAEIAAKPGYEVVLLVRDETKARRAVEEIKRTTGNARVRHEIVDVSRKAAIHAVVGRWEGPLHVLVNNAATTPLKRLETPEGIELQFATNVLGYFWLTRAFASILQASAPSRVVDVASYWAGNLDIKDLEFKRRQYRNGTAYRQSKQANRMLAVAQAARFAGQGVTVNVCHPGDVSSKLSNNLGFGGSESPAAGARTPIWLAIEPIGAEVTGKYFEHEREARCRFGEDHTAVETLYEICSMY